MVNQLATAFDTPQYRPSREKPVINIFPFPLHKLAMCSSPLLEKQAGFARNWISELDSLQQHYLILDSDHTIIKILQEEPNLYELLMEAVKPLEDVFGTSRIIQIRVQLADEDYMLRVAVQLPSNFEGEPEHKLNSFHEAWWLDNCHRSGGTLVFDYELRDAI
ncbi:hypothetical protein [Candidatus Cyanaurora vandensis]|uniref:hypothetical protein n=1 Tax=Candidatus Cyanaurora vandensis TaxID=2714958 RepID=UPI00257D65C4|nr:hypothetical protein [Candidatus Cyanaurora vandensis]